MIHFFRKIRQSFLSENKIGKYLKYALGEIVRLNAARMENEALLFNFEFQNHFVITSEIMVEKDEIYQRALDEIDDILRFIDYELSGSK